MTTLTMDTLRPTPGHHQKSARSVRNADALDATLARIRAGAKVKFAALHDLVTPIQMATLACIAHGMSVEEIGLLLDIAEGTVAHHRTEVCSRLFIGNWQTAGFVAVAAWWMWRERNREYELRICRDRVHCRCADILEGISGDWQRT